MAVPTLVWALCAVLLSGGATAQAALAAEPAVLTAVVNRTMAFHFAPKAAGGPSLESIADSFPLSARNRRPSGVFVTLSKNGKSRACWGSVFPEHGDVVHATVYATIGALTKEYRYPPIKRSEWRQLKPQVTVVRAVEPIHGLSGLNPVRDGLMVRGGGKAGVILPGECTDAHYQLVQCRLKAGIAANEPCQLYRIKAEIYE